MREASRSIGPRPVPPPTREGGRFPRPRTPSTSKQPSVKALLPPSPGGPLGISTPLRPQRFPARARLPSPTPAATEMASSKPGASYWLVQPKRNPGTSPDRPDLTRATLSRGSLAWGGFPPSAVSSTSPRPKPRTGTREGATRARRESPSQHVRSGAEANSKRPEHPMRHHLSPSWPGPLEG